MNKAQECLNHFSSILNLAQVFKIHFYKKVKSRQQKCYWTHYQNKSIIFHNKFHLRDFLGWHLFKLIELIQIFFSELQTNQKVTNSSSSFLWTSGWMDLDGLPESLALTKLPCEGCLPQSTAFIVVLDLYKPLKSKLGHLNEPDTFQFIWIKITH